MAVMIFTAPANLYFLVFYLVFLLSSVMCYTEKTTNKSSGYEMLSGFCQLRS